MTGVMTSLRRRPGGRRTTGRLLLLMAVWLSALSVQAEEVELTHNGTVLTGRLQPGDDWPGGQAVLLLHGTLSHRDTEIIESMELLFGDAGFTTLAVNLGLNIDRRSGPADCAGEHRHRESDASDELALWVDWLDTAGADDVTLLGHSRGAYQVARYRLDSADDRIRRMILVAPPTWSAAGARDAYRERHGADLDTLRAAAQALVDGGRGGDLLPGNVGLLYCEGGRVSAESFLSYYADDSLRNTPTLLQQLDTPTLLVTGSEDTVVTGLAEALAEAEPGRLTHVRHVDIVGADHFFRDLYADELMDAALEFFDDTP